MKKKEKNYFRK